MKPRSPLLPKARELRNNATDAEHLLWRQLRNRQLTGIKFRRQQAIEGYICDFVSFTPKLVIELDGGQHAASGEYDAKRDACLRRNGFTVLRLWNGDIFTNMEGVLEVIRRHVEGEVASLGADGTFPHPLAPSRQGRGNLRNRL